MGERTLITINVAAQIIYVSRATIYRMIQAGDYDQKILDGLKTEQDVLIEIQVYLGCVFPKMIRLGPRCVHVNRAEVEAWVKTRSASPNDRFHALWYALWKNLLDETRKNIYP